MQEKPFTLDTMKHVGSLDLVDLHTYNDRSLLDEFHQTVYEPAFPIRTQREDSSIWAARLWGTGSNDAAFELHVLIIGESLRDAAQRRIYGGIVCEYYGESRSGLLTYIAVVPEVRGRGLGSLLYRRALDVLRNAAAERGVALSAVYGEVTNPLTNISDDVMDPWDRLTIMQRWGGRVIDIKYAQPELTSGQGPDYNLLLLYFPKDERQAAWIPSRSVLAFLREFYMSLGITDPDSNQDFDEMLMSISGDEIKLVTMIPERPVLEFPNYGIALHFVRASGENESECDGLNQSAASAYNVFESFEHDLVAYSFRHARPFRSVPIESTRELEVEVLFPPYLDYVSEGRIWRLCTKEVGSDPRRVWTKVVPSKTVFTAGVTVYNMVLTSCDSDDRGSLNEYDVIRFVKLYAPSEEFDGTDQLRIGFEDKVLELSVFLETVFGESVITPHHLRAGTLQLLTGEERREEWHQVFQLGELLNSQRTEAIAQIDDLIESEAPAAERLMAINGILTGIFDFHRIDAWELGDVLQSVYESTEDLVYLHKGNMMSITPDDRPFKLAECRSQIGISPYLMLPHIALLYNEEVLQTAAKAIPDQGVQGIKKPEDVRARMDKLLSSDLLPNVFEYMSERRIFEHGYRERGLEEKRLAVSRSLEWLTRHIEAQTRKRSRRGDIFMQAVVTLLTLIFAKNIVFELLAGYSAWHWPAYLIIIGIVVTLFCVHIARAGEL